MIVAGPEGFRTGQYRKFNIKSAATNDDFAMMREVFTRRFARAQEEDPDRDKGIWPDLVLIDGGKGQLSAARAVLEELGIEDVCMVGVAQGAAPWPRRPRSLPPDGRQRTHAPDQRPGIVPHPKAPRRSPPLRHRRPPRQAR